MKKNTKSLVKDSSSSKGNIPLVVTSIWSFAKAHNPSRLAVCSGTPREQGQRGVEEVSREVLGFCCLQRNFCSILARLRALLPKTGSFITSGTPLNPYCKNKSENFFPTLRQRVSLALFEEKNGS